MCGIVGYIGKNNSVPIILEGLRRLEYRGYDSAGLCTIDKGHFQLRKKTGRIDELAGLLRKQPAPGLTGIGHTRWATHGTPTDANILQLTRAGVATGLVRLPGRYIHSPVEILALRDAEYASQLIAEWICTLRPQMSFLP